MPASDAKLLKAVEASLLNLLGTAPNNAMVKDLDLPEEVDLMHLADSLVDARSLVSNLGQQSIPQSVEMGRLDEEVRLRAGIALPLLAAAAAAAERLRDGRGALVFVVSLVLVTALLVEAKRIAASTRETFVHLIVARQAQLPGLVAAAMQIDPSAVRASNPSPYG